jgi:hypothetical protein
MTKMQPKRPFLSTLSNDALCKLRDEVAALLNSRRRELDRLNGTHGIGASGAANAPKAQRKKNAPKYHDGPDGGT